MTTASTAGFVAPVISLSFAVTADSVSTVRFMIPAMGMGAAREMPLPAAAIVAAAAVMGSVRNLVRGAGFPSSSDEAIAEHDGELGLCLGPFARRHFPLLSDLAQD